MLGQNGYDVLSATKIAEAVEVARASSKLSLLFTDVNLGESTGIQVAAAVREFHPDVPVLLMSGNAQTMLERGSAPRAPVDFLQ